MSPLTTEQVNDLAELIEAGGQWREISPGHALSAGGTRAQEILRVFFESVPTLKQIALFFLERPNMLPECLTPKPVTSEYDGHLLGWEPCNTCPPDLAINRLRKATEGVG